MLKEEVLMRIRDTGIVPVLRAPSPSLARKLAEAIAEGGINILEVTMTVPDAVQVIRELRHEHPELLIGAGTVLDPETAKRCISEGAEFVVSPALNIGTIHLCLEMGVPIFPGALTPTEIITAWQAGGDVIKVFPASAMGGASYLKSIKAPFPDVPLIPTGGVSLGTARQFLDAGAIALGVGADLCDVHAATQGRMKQITETARAYRDIVIEAQQARL